MRYKPSYISPIWESIRRFASFRIKKLVVDCAAIPDKFQVKVIAAGHNCKRALLEARANRSRIKTVVVKSYINLG